VRSHVEEVICEKPYSAKLLRKLGELHIESLFVMTCVGGPKSEMAAVSKMA
jgi:hypothetical protein